MKAEYLTARLVRVALGESKEGLAMISMQATQDAVTRVPHLPFMKQSVIVPAREFAAIERLVDVVGELLRRLEGVPPDPDDDELTEAECRERLRELLVEIGEDAP